MQTRRYGSAYFTRVVQRKAYLIPIAPSGFPASAGKAQAMLPMFITIVLIIHLVFIETQCSRFVPFNSILAHRVVFCPSHDNGITPFVDNAMLAVEEHGQARSGMYSFLFYLILRRFVPLPCFCFAPLHRCANVHRKLNKRPSYSPRWECGIECIKTK